MAKMKLFHRSTKQTLTDEPTRQQEKDEPQIKQTTPKTTTKYSKTPIKEYNETLYSKGFALKKPITTVPEERPLIHRAAWENAETIEHNIDSMDIERAGNLSNQSQKGFNTEKKVDFILLKKKK